MDDARHQENLKKLTLLYESMFGLSGPMWCYGLKFEPDVKVRLYLSNGLVITTSLDDIEIRRKDDADAA